VYIYILLPLSFVKMLLTACWKFWCMVWESSPSTAV